MCIKKLVVMTHCASQTIGSACRAVNNVSLCNYLIQIFFFNVQLVKAIKFHLVKNFEILVNIV